MLLCVSIAHMENEKLELIREYFGKQPVLKAYLFGSEARMQGSEDSDVDLIIELDRTKPIGLDFIQMKLDLEDRLDRRVDLVTSKSISKYLRPSIDRDKIMIYER